MNPSTTIENTRLWQITLAPQSGIDSHARMREHLRAAFLSVRDRAAQIAGEIPRELPDFTVHDVTHLDALWEMADTVMDDSDGLTPTEAFVLGCAFLVHDLGMGLAAYPGGEEALSKDSRWRDVVAALIRVKVGRPPTNEELASPDASVKREAVRVLLRELHAEHAKRMPLEAWAASGGGRLYLIVDDEIRQWAGETIGRVAHSHWLDVSALQGEFKQVIAAPSGYPRDWTVDPLRLACLLRIADAIHIDSRRAPLFLRALRRLDGVADAHWNFQQKLNPPRLSVDRLEYTSGASFSADEAKAWWLGFEYLQMIGRELRQVDALLADAGRKRFAARSVTGIEEPARFAEFVRPSDWTPVDARVHASDVIALVEKLGGAQLYGSDGDTPVPLRELIQNAADAVRARRVLEKEADSWGKITVRTGCDEHGNWLEVEDNGIGMPRHVLTGVLLDFGTSYWQSNAVRHDWPGLLAESFEPCGQYGIGFFSVFMWGHKVRVISRPYHEGMGKTNVLEFTAGPRERPLLRAAKREEWIRDGGSRVRVWLKATLNELDPRGLNMEERCANLCPTLDVDLWVEGEGIPPIHAVGASDWQTIPGKQLLWRMWPNRDQMGIEAVEQRMAQYGDLIELIRDDRGRPIGRACLHNNSVVPSGAITVGGLRAQYLRGIGGVLLGDSGSATRKVATPKLGTAQLSEWMTKQARAMSDARLFPDNDHFENIYAHDSAKVVVACGGYPGPLPIGYFRGKSVSADDIANVKDLGDELIVVTQGMGVHGPTVKNVYVGPEGARWSGQISATLDANVLIQRTSGITEVILGENDWGRWPSVKELPMDRRDLPFAIATALAKAWSVPVESVFVGGQTREQREVGIAAGERVSTHATVFRRPK